MPGTLSWHDPGGARRVPRAARAAARMQGGRQARLGQGLPLGPGDLLLPHSVLHDPGLVPGRGQLERTSTCSGVSIPGGSEAIGKASRKGGRQVESWSPLPKGHTFPVVWHVVHAEAEGPGAALTWWPAWAHQPTHAAGEQGRQEQLSEDTGPSYPPGPPSRLLIKGLSFLPAFFKS